MLVGVVLVIKKWLSDNNYLLKKLNAYIYENKYSTNININLRLFI
jgi:hypothetical protein